MSEKTHTASYNSQNQLTKYDDLSYNYDADGNRVSAGDTKFVYDDNGHLLSDGTNTYVYGASGVVGYYDKDGKFVTYLFNQRGDVVKETDESGSVTNSFDYNDYGKLVGSDHAAGSVFGYGGQYGAVTDKNGLVFLRTRYYNPEIMRFMNRDTVRGSIVDTKSLNRFAYVEGNPLTYVDPNGQAATWLKNDPLDVLYYGLMGLSFVPGLNIVASVGMMAIDIAKGDYTSLAMDSLGVVIPGAAAGLKLSYNGVKAFTDGVKVGNEVRDVAKANTELVRTVDTYRSVKSETQVSASTAMTTFDKSTDEMSKAYEYSMMNPSDLDYKIASTFRSGFHNKGVFEKDVILHRNGNSLNGLGEFFTRESHSAIETRTDLAVKSTWTNRDGLITGHSTLEKQYDVKIPAGTEYYEGPVGNQGGIYSGGGNQIYIPSPWNIKGVEVVGERNIR